MMTHASRASTIEPAAPGDRPPSADPHATPGMYPRVNKTPAATRSLPFAHDSRDDASDPPATAEAPAIVPPAIASPVAPDLARILPPAEWLTPEQRRTWLLAAAAYRANGLAPLAAEQEATAELVMTGQLTAPGPWRPFPDLTARGPKSSDPSIDPARDIAFCAKPERPNPEHRPENTSFQPTTQLQPRRGVADLRAKFEELSDDNRRNDDQANR